MGPTVQTMKLIDALLNLPAVRILRIRVTDADDPSGWQAEPIESPVLREEEGFFIVSARNILPDGAVLPCYMDLSLPERINDRAYFVRDRSLQVIDYPYRQHGDMICAVPIDCFGLYDLFYSRIRPETGIQILREGLAASPRKHYIAEDLGYILRDEKRFDEAAEAFQIAVDDGPSSYFVYGELASCYSMIGESGKARVYHSMFQQADHSQHAKH